MMTDRVRYPWLLTGAGLMVVAVMLLPVYWMISASLQHGVTSANVQWLPLQPDLSGYATAIKDQVGNIQTSLIVAIGSALGAIAIATPAAFGLSRLRSRLVDVVLMVILLTQMIPGIVLSNAFYSMFSGAGLLNTYLALIIANSTMGVPFAIIVLRSFMLSIDTEVLEAATLDGAGPVRSFLAMVLPLSRNAVITASVFAFIYGWGDFLFGLTLSNTSAVRPVTIGIYQYIGAKQISWDAVMASSLLASVPAIILLLVSQKYIKAGLGAGAGK